jgi:hypothetical protein
MSDTVTVGNLKEVLKTKSDRLNVVNAGIEECGGFYADLSHDPKLSVTRNKLKKERSQLMYNIDDLEEIITEMEEGC